MRIRKRIIYMLCLSCALVALGGIAAQAQGESTPYAITERHVYLQDGQEVLIPQPFAIRVHFLADGKSLTLRPRAYAGFLAENTASVLIDAPRDEPVTFYYQRVTAQPVASVTLSFSSDANVPLLWELAQGTMLTLYQNGEAVVSEPLNLTSGEMTAVIPFPACYTHTPEGIHLQYEVQPEALHSGFAARVEGLSLTLTQASRRVHVTHVYREDGSLYAIPQEGAVYTLTRGYGDSVLVPNRDFDGFWSDLNNPSEYFSALTRDEDITFHHYRASGIMAQVTIVPGASTAPYRLASLIRGQNPVRLTVDGEVVAEGYALFDPMENTALVPFVDAYTHTPQGSPIGYQLTPMEEIAGFDAESQGLSLLLHPKALTVAVTHQYESDSGIYATIPQTGGSEVLQILYGDDITVHVPQFEGFEAYPMGDTQLSAVLEDTTLVYDHVRTSGDLSTRLWIAGSERSNLQRLASALSDASLRLTGGELPPDGRGVTPAVTAASMGLDLTAEWTGVYTHSPSGEAYAYAITLRGFSPLEGAQVTASARAGEESQGEMALPAVHVAVRTRYDDGQSLRDIPGQQSQDLTLTYGDQLAVDAPELAGYVAMDTAQTVDYLTSDLSMDFNYHRSTLDTPVQGELIFAGEPTDYNRPTQATVSLVCISEASQEDLSQVLACGKEQGNTVSFAFDQVPTHDLDGHAYSTMALEMDWNDGGAYGTTIDAVPGGFQVRLQYLSQDSGTAEEPVHENPSPISQEREEPPTTEPEPVPPHEPEPTMQEDTPPAQRSNQRPQ